MMGRISFRSFSTSSIKPFDSIPGPTSVPCIGTLWLYLPRIGKYRFDRLHRNGFLKLKEYGTLVREDIVPGVPIVWVYKPEDIETVYRCEGRYPQRRSHLALQKYRLDRPDTYNSGGLLPTNGPAWGRLRKIFQQDISKVKNVRMYLPKSDGIMKHFLECRASKIKTDLLPELSRLFLELIGLVAFDESLNCFAESELNRSSRTSKLIEAAAVLNSVILQTDNGPQLWKKFDTPLYRKMSQAHLYIETIAKEFINKKMSSQELKQNSLLELYLSNKELDLKDVLGMTVDMLLAGIDTMSYSSSFALYHISKNTQKQAKIFTELSSLMSVDDPVTEDILNKSVYTKAAIKEVFRMNPISVGVGRILAKDAVLSNFHVPAGTVVVTQNQVTCRLAEYFPDPDVFIPERWLRECQHQDIHPYLVLPFGHGPRTCIARRLAEQNMQLLIINAVRKFKLTWTGKELDCRSIQINKPDGEILVRFEKRFE